MSRIILVAAMAQNRVIGKNNVLPWDIPEEMEDMRAFIRGKTILAGRKTCEGIGRVLPKKRNIMLTRDPTKVQVGKLSTIQTPDGNWIVDGGETGIIEIYTSVEDIFEHIKPEEDLIIFGGSEIYRLFLDHPLAEIRMSEIHESYDGDTYFPAFEELYDEVSRENKGSYDLVWYKRKSKNRNS